MYNMDKTETDNYKIPLLRAFDLTSWLDYYNTAIEMLDKIIAEGSVSSDGRLDKVIEDLNKLSVEVTDNFAKINAAIEDAQTELDNFQNVYSVDKNDVANKIAQANTDIKGVQDGVKSVTDQLAVVSGQVNSAVEIANSVAEVTKQENVACHGDPDNTTMLTYRVTRSLNQVVGQVNFQAKKALAVNDILMNFSIAPSYMGEPWYLVGTNVTQNKPIVLMLSLGGVVSTKEPVASGDYICIMANYATGVQ